MGLKGPGPAGRFCANGPQPDDQPAGSPHLSEVVVLPTAIGLGCPPALSILEHIEYRSQHILGYWDGGEVGVAHPGAPVHQSLVTVQVHPGSGRLKPAEIGGLLRNLEEPLDQPAEEHITRQPTHLGMSIQEKPLEAVALAVQCVEMGPVLPVGLLGHQPIHGGDATGLAGHP